MPDTPEERGAALERALAAGTAQGVPASQTLAYLMAPPGPATTNDLWKWLVRGLIVLLVGDLVGLLVFIGLGKSVTVPLTVFTTTLAGLLGLFAPTPKQ
jgi:hypothetical protein